IHRKTITIPFVQDAGSDRKSYEKDAVHSPAQSTLPVPRVRPFGCGSRWCLRNRGHHPPDSSTRDEAVHKNQHAVKPADDLDHASALNCWQCRPNDLISAQARELSEKPFVVRKNAHLGFRRSRTQRHDSDSGAPELLSQGLGERKDERLARGVDSEVGKRLKG